MDIIFKEMIVPLLVVFFVTAGVTAFIFWMIDKKKIENGTSKVKLAEAEALKIQMQLRDRINKRLRIGENE